MDVKATPANLPHSDYLERQTLGAMIVFPSSLETGLSTLTEKDFFLDSHRKLFRAMKGVRDAGLNVDYTSVRKYLEDRSELNAIGGVSYIVNLDEGLPRNFDISTHVTLLRQQAQMRRAITIHYEGYEAADAWRDEPRRYIQDSVTELQALLDDNEQEELKHIAAVLEEAGPAETAVDRMATLNGIKLGFYKVDNATHGGQPGELIVVAARPSMGKTAFMTTAAGNQAIAGKRIAVFTFEQKKETIIRRTISGRSRVDSNHIRANTLTHRERETFLRYQQEMMNTQFYVDDQAGLNASRIRAKCLKLQRSAGPLDAVWIDQLSFVEWDDVWEKGVNDSALIGRQTRKLKMLAKELGCPVYLLVQLNRDVAKRTDPKPRLSDLAESGKIEQNADVILFLHRPEYYDRTDESLKGKGLMILAKNREGATDEYECEFIGNIFRWDDVTPPASEQSYFSAYGNDW